MKNEVYSWRLSSARKDALEQEARRSGKSVAELLEAITEEWLRARRESAASEAKIQERLKRAARGAIGALSSGDPDRSRDVKRRIRERLRRRRGR
jgi:hypothetical protein